MVQPLPLRGQEAAQVQRRACGHGGADVNVAGGHAGGRNMGQKGCAMITNQQEQRLRGSMKGLFRSPDFMTVRQFLTAESARDEPDYAGLKNLVLSIIGDRIDEEVEGIKARRGRERAGVI